MKLKTKLALMSIAVSSVMCVVITVSAVSSVSGLTASIAISPAANTIPMQEIIMEASVQDIPAAALVATKAYNFERYYVLAAIAVAGALLTWLLAGCILKPLEKLTSDVKAISPDTLDKLPVLPATRDEVGRLSEAFGEMSQQIGQAYNLQKSFSASAAHELRTPLTVLANEIDVFKMQKEHTEEEYEEFTASVRQSADRLSGIVEDLLTFTNQNAPNTATDVFLKPLLTEIAEELATIAEKKNIVIEVKGTDAKISADDSLMQRAFYNLVENAVKYSPDNTAVTINITESCVCVSDIGCGIPENEKLLVFEPFYRVDKSRSRAAGGSGLGLAIVKQIVQKHGFSVTVTDNKPVGSVFKVSF